jgi:hypothetical protein
MHNEASKELVGCQVCTSWKRDYNYDLVENVSMASWHNTAAEIAMEENPKNPQVRVFFLKFFIPPCLY